VKEAFSDIAGVVNYPAAKKGLFFAFSMAHFFQNGCLK
jgi:hypothetical protein